MLSKPPFLKNIKRVHLVGIKGVAMTALACYFRDLGLKVGGNDIEEVFVTDEVLAKRKIKWRLGFNEDFLKIRPDLVITTPAHGGSTNPQVKAAMKAGIKFMTQAEVLGGLMKSKEGIAVCGVGGKTTTSAMIATVLELALQKPSYLIGVGSIDPLGYPGRCAGGKQIVIEADEYANSPPIDNRPKFSFLSPRVCVVTNIEFDHPDIYADLSAFKTVFGNFFKKIPPDGLLVANADNPNALEVASKSGAKVQTYGFSPQADWRVERASFKQEKTLFSLAHREALIDQIELKVPGKFNVLNATAVFAVGTFLGLSAPTIKKGLAAFKGTKRRFEFIGEAGRVRVYDDYAHHPEEIKATLAAVKQWLPGRRVTVVFQPHTYSRTKALFQEFARAFSLADRVMITDIYASARESDDLGMSGQVLANEIKRSRSRVTYLADEKQAADYLQATAQSGDVVITMGAGDIFRWHNSILESLKSKKS